MTKLAVALAAVSLVTAGSLLSTSGATAPLVPEIASPWLDDLARASFTNKGWVILYNPQRCKDIGADACAFFRMHEYGHITLNHATALYTQVIGGRALAEAEADCFAAKNAFAVQVKAAIAFLESKEMADTSFDAFHKKGRERAKQIRTCRSL